MSRWRVSDESGTIMPLIIISTLVLFVVLAFSVDQSLAYAAKARQENAIDTLRHDFMDPSCALRIKNAQDPGKEMAYIAEHSLQQGGFSGHTTLWFFEEPAQSKRTSERYWTVGIELVEEAQTVFARGFGVKSISVASHKVINALIYASEQVWQPDQCLCGRYEFLVPGAHIGFTPLTTLDAFPDEIVQAAQGSENNERNVARKKV